MKPKLIFLIPDLKEGGAQRVASILMNKLVQYGYDIKCVVYDRQAVHFELTDQVEILSISIDKKNILLRNAITGFIIKVARLRAILKKNKPDLIFPIMTSMNLLSICSNREAPIILNHHTFTKRWSIKYFLVKFLYQFAGYTVVPSKSLEKELKKLSAQIPIVRIANPLEIDTIRNQSVESFNNVYGKYLLYVGRLSVEKGVDLLIETFKKLNDLSLSLVIVGVGPELPELKRIADLLGISKNVYFVGSQRNPFKWMKYAECLILPSRQESFGLVLLEALACGCKVVAFDCYSGPDEILDHGKYGMLARPLDTDDLAIKIRDSMNSSFPENIENWLTNYKADDIVAQYDDLIKRVLNQKSLTS